MAGEQVDPHAVRLVYEQAADIIRGRIGSGEYPAGRVLPARDRLGAELGCSRKSIERALGILRAEGLVVTVTGKGVYVAER